MFKARKPNRASFWSRRRLGKRPATRQLRLEHLERREMFDASAVLDGGLLTITADDAGCDVQVVAQDGQISVMSGDRPLVTMPELQVQQIEFQGGAGNDAFANQTSLPSQIYGHGGDDTLHGGSGDDVVEGGDGDDTLYGHGGDDVLYGDGGQDLLSGGSGADFLDGGADQDRLDGGEGADELVLDPEGTSSLIMDEAINVADEDQASDLASLSSANTSDALNHSATISQDPADDPQRDELAEQLAMETGSDASP